MYSLGTHRLVLIKTKTLPRPPSNTVYDDVALYPPFVRNQMEKNGNKNSFGMVLGECVMVTGDLCIDIIFFSFTDSAIFRIPCQPSQYQWLYVYLLFPLSISHGLVPVCASCYGMALTVYLYRLKLEPISIHKPSINLLENAVWFIYACTIVSHVYIFCQECQSI